MRTLQPELNKDDPRLLPARERPDRLLVVVPLKPKLSERVPNLLVIELGEAALQVRDGRELGDELLRRVLRVHADAHGARGLHAALDGRELLGEQLEQRRLARPVRADERDARVNRHAKRDPFKQEAVGRVTECHVRHGDERVRALAAGFKFDRDPVVLERLEQLAPVLARLHEVARLCALSQKLVTILLLGFRLRPVRF
mmetsp:Transcript_12132/g.38314  ORF Transcript_12132/g.38314 Transcript_12132/m.38314 type:complete len:200 (+) Transcript_12132:945-1544(+)